MGLQRDTKPDTSSSLLCPECPGGYLEEDAREPSILEGGTDEEAFLELLLLFRTLPFRL